MKKLLLLIVLVVAGCGTSTYGKNYSVSWQNDVVGGTDENFTNGIEISHSAKASEANSIHKEVASSLPALRIFETDPEKMTTIKTSIRQDMYTPDQLDRSDIIENENPYAGTLTLDIERISATKDKRLSTKLRLGASGDPSLADKTQVFVHDTMTDLGKKQTHPAGWDNQIESEPLLNLDNTRSWQNYRTKYHTSRSAIITRMGNINTDVAAVHGWKFGHNIPDFNRENLADKDLSVYTFLDFFGTARARNIYYDGGVFRDSVHTVDKEILVAGSDTGVGLEYNNYSVKVHYNIRTKDYKEQDKEFHAYGFLTIGTDW